LPEIFFISALQTGGKYANISYIILNESENAMKETLFLKLDRNLASPTESADRGKKTIGNTPKQTD